MLRMCQNLKGCSYNPVPVSPHQLVTLHRRQKSALSNCPAQLHSGFWKMPFLLASFGTQHTFITSMVILNVCGSYNVLKINTELMIGNWCYYITAQDLSGIRVQCLSWLSSINIWFSCISLLQWHQRLYLSSKSVYADSTSLLVVWKTTNFFFLGPIRMMTSGDVFNYSFSWIMQCLACSSIQ